MVNILNIFKKLFNRLKSEITDYFKLNKSLIIIISILTLTNLLLQYFTTPTVSLISIIRFIISIIIVILIIGGIRDIKNKIISLILFILILRLDTDYGFENKFKIQFIQNIENNYIDTLRIIEKNENFEGALKHRFKGINIFYNKEEYSEYYLSKSDSLAIYNLLYDNDLEEIHRQDNYILLVMNVFIDNGSGFIYMLNNEIPDDSDLKIFWYQISFGKRYLSRWYWVSFS